MLMLLYGHGDKLTCFPSKQELVDAEAGDGIETLAQNMPNNIELKNSNDVFSFPGGTAVEDELVIVFPDGRVFSHAGALMNDLYLEFKQYEMAKFKQIV